MVADEADPEDPAVKERDAIVAELNRRKNKAKATPSGFRPVSEMTDEEIMEELRQIGEEIGNFADEVDVDDPLVKRRDELVAELNRRKK